MISSSEDYQMISPETKVIFPFQLEELMFFACVIWGSLFTLFQTVLFSSIYFGVNGVHTFWRMYLKWRTRPIPIWKIDTRCFQTKATHKQIKILHDIMNFEWMGVYKYIHWINYPKYWSAVSVSLRAIIGYLFIN